MDIKGSNVAGIFRIATNCELSDQQIVKRIEVWRQISAICRLE
jgi:hypothetical protein